MEITHTRARGVLDDAEFVHLAVDGRHGPHVTPLAFEWEADRIWVVTPRGSAKVRAIRRHRRVGGLVRYGRRALAFTGRADIHDPIRGRGVDSRAAW